MRYVPTNEQLLIQAIPDAVRMAIEANEALNVDAIAIRLSSRFAQSGLSIDEIAARVAATVKDKSTNR